MVEQKTSLGEATITVTFKWDSGDRSVGIGEGWGEDTGVEIKAGPFLTYILFDISEEPVKDWRIDEVQCAYEAEPNERGSRRLIMLADEVEEGTSAWYQSRGHRETLGGLPKVCKAVEAAWAQVKAIEALESVGERIWDLEEQIHDIQEGAGMMRPLSQVQNLLELAKAERDRLQAEYKAKYEEPGEPRGIKGFGSSGR